MTLLVTLVTVAWFSTSTRADQTKFRRLWANWKSPGETTKKCTCATTVHLSYLSYFCHPIFCKCNELRSELPIHTHFNFIVPSKESPYLCYRGKVTRRHFTIAFSHSCIWHCCWNKFKEYSECLSSHVNITEWMSFCVVYEVFAHFFANHASLSSCLINVIVPVVWGIWVVVSAFV